MWNPDWGGAHTAYAILTIPDSTRKIELAHSVTDSVFFHYSHYWGTRLTPSQQSLFQVALDHQRTALADLRAGNLDGYIINMQQALDNHKAVNPGPIDTIFLDDSEAGPNGWTHGGAQDEWELGIPTHGPARTHSGEKCWGVDLDNTYENNADCRLMSRPIELTDYACAYLSFWVWNSVEDAYSHVYDPLWLDITTDGAAFHPLCSKAGGVNDDPEIPDVGGWSLVTLDLTKYLDSTVQIRFRFESDASVVQPGPYIDDVCVYGRATSSGMEEKPGCEVQNAHLGISPNPFRRSTTIGYELTAPGCVTLEIRDIAGRTVRMLVNSHRNAGSHAVQWNGRDNAGRPVQKGVYFCRLDAGGHTSTSKMVMH